MSKSEKGNIRITVEEAVKYTEVYLLSIKNYIQIYIGDCGNDSENKVCHKILEFVDSKIKENEKIR